MTGDTPDPEDMSAAWAGQNAPAPPGGWQRSWTAGSAPDDDGLADDATAAAEVPLQLQQHAAGAPADACSPVAKFSQCACPLSQAYEQHQAALLLNSQRHQQQLRAAAQQQQRSMQQQHSQAAAASPTAEGARRAIAGGADSALAFQSGVSTGSGSPFSPSSAAAAAAGGNSGGAAYNIRRSTTTDSQASPVEALSENTWTMVSVL